MRAVLHLDDDLAAHDFVGLTLAAWMQRVVQRAGFDLVEAADGELALHIDGRFAAVRPATLSRLRLPGDAAVTPDGRVVAAIGHGPEVLHEATGDTLSGAEAHDAATAVGRSRAARAVRLQLAVALEESGVQVVDPARLTVDACVTVEPGAILWPDVVLRGDTHVATDAEIRPGCWLEDTHVGASAVVKPHCVCEGARIGPRSQVGPMAHLRPGAELVSDNKVGNFVEVKKATLHEGAKASHLTYLGDAEIGAHANIGAGTITCNYDGHRKHKTTIGERAFIGSNSALVAPVTIGAGAIVGAGSTITKSIPDDALAVVRGDARVLPGKGKVLNERNARLKAQDKARARAETGER